MGTTDAITDQAHRGGWLEPTTERVLRMLDLLNTIARHPDIGGALALKGGPHLAAFEWNFARLSVDLDFNFVGGVTREQLMEARPIIEAALIECARSEGLTPRRVRDDHGGSKWRMTYRALTGANGTVEIDVNYMSRVPLEPAQRRSTMPLPGVELRNILVMSTAEVASGKLLALLDRTRARDVYDAHRIIGARWHEQANLRRAFVVGLAGARRPWREILAAPIELDAAEIDRMLLPLLRIVERPKAVDVWADALCRDVDSGVRSLRTPTADEVAFLDAVAERGEIDPALLGIDADDPVHGRILASPILEWKSHNVRSQRDGS